MAPRSTTLKGIQMRKITSHIVEGDSANHQLKIEVTDEPGAGGANHLYHITGFNTKTNVSDPFTELSGFVCVGNTVLFQNGPIKEVGVNGVTHEALLAIVIDRLESFQTGPFASSYNQMALDYSRLALKSLQHRTRERIARGVEGTHQQ
jgi:hypothetical protein